MTTIERAMLANQYRILALLDEAESANHLYKAKIAEHGYEGLYANLLESIEEGTSREICEETHKILTMYHVINNFLTTLTQAQKDAHALNRIEFEGFDANHDKHYHFMQFIVEEGGLYDEYTGGHFNSHSMGSIAKYRRMLPVYERAMAANNHRLDLAGLQAIIAAA